MARGRAGRPQALGPPAGRVVCSFDLDRPTVQRVLDAGADAFLPKPATCRELAAALESPHADAVGSWAVVAGVA